MAQTDRPWIIDAEPVPERFDPARAIAALAGQPGDSVGFLEKVTRLLGELTAVPNVPLPHQLETLDSLDRLAKNHQITLVADYLETARLRKLAESHLWAASFGFWRAMGDAYMDLIRRFQAGGDDAAHFHAQMHKVVCRAIRALALQHKWTLLRYGRVEERIWRDLGAAYGVAARWDFAIRHGAIYPGAHGNASPQEELLKPLMLSVAAPDTLTPLQQHIAERLVSFFASHFALHATPGPGCGYSFDLTLHQPPSRAKRGAGPAPLLRFFGPGTAGEALQALAAQIKASGVVPPDTPVTRGFAVADVARVVNYLLGIWSDAATGRRQRREVFTRLTVVPGLAASLKWWQDMARSGDAGLEPGGAAERWVGVDASASGQGAVLAEAPQWLSPGVLIGLRGEASNIARMGLVRRIGADRHGQCRVGIELIGDGALPVALFDIANRHAADPQHAGEAGILLSRRPDAEGCIELLYRPESFQRNRKLQLRYRERVVAVEYLSSLARGSDYHWARFRVSGG